MREELVECKECRFWIQSANWLFRMRSDECCGHGELKEVQHLA